MLWRGSWLVYRAWPGPVMLLVETWESLVGQTWEGAGKGSVIYHTGRTAGAYARWNASCRWTWNSRVQLRLGPVFPSINLNVQRVKFLFPKPAPGHDDVWCGAASPYQALAPALLANQPATCTTDGFVWRVYANARIIRVTIHILTYEHCIQDKTLTYDP